MSNQNIYDNETFFEGYKSLRAGETNYNDLLEQPAMAKMLPDLTAKDVLAAEKDFADCDVVLTQLETSMESILESKKLAKKYTTK